MADERRDRRPSGAGERRPRPASSAGDRRRRPEQARSDAPRKPRRSDGRSEGRSDGRSEGKRRDQPRAPLAADRPPVPPGLARKENEPRLPAEVDTSLLHRSVRAELRGLPKDLAEVVAGHLVLAGQLIDTDPELAYGHAEAARRRAARLPIVREAAAETAYAAGHFDVALSEFRALRRMTGMSDYLPVMADCERALGRPQAAIKLAKESRRISLDAVLQVEMIIVEAGARADLGQAAEGLRVLELAVSRADERPGVPPASMARLHYAYADALLRAGQDSEARRWFASAAEDDVDGSTDAAERRDALDGLTIAFDESEHDEHDESSSGVGRPVEEGGR